jgi:hypothetical protein
MKKALIRFPLFLIRIGREEKSILRSLDLNYRDAIAGLYMAEGGAGIKLRAQSHCGNLLWIDDIFHSAHLLYSVKIILEIQFQGVSAKSYSSNFK